MVPLPVSVCLRSERRPSRSRARPWVGVGVARMAVRRSPAEADDIAGERGEITEQGVEAVHREWFAPRFGEGRLCYAVECVCERPCDYNRGSALATTEVRCAWAARIELNGIGGLGVSHADDRPACTARRGRAPAARSNGIPDAAQEIDGLQRAEGVLDGAETF